VRCKGPARNALARQARVTATSAGTHPPSPVRCTRVVGAHGPLACWRQFLSATLACACLPCNSAVICNHSWHDGEKGSFLLLLHASRLNVLVECRPAHQRSLFLHNRPGTAGQQQAEQEPHRDDTITRCDALAFPDSKHTTESSYFWIFVCSPSFSKVKFI
jgi:hypothetical protein